MMIDELSLERVAHITDIFVRGGNLPVALRNGRVEQRMEHEDPLPRTLLDQMPDLLDEQRRGGDSPREGRGVENDGALVAGQLLHLGRAVEVGLRPAGLVDAEIAVLAFEFAERRGAARPLRAVDIETAPDGEVVVHGLEPLAVGIAVEDGDLDSREEVGDVAHRREDGDRVVRHHLPDAHQASLARDEHVRTARFEEPGRLTAPAADLRLQGPQNRIGIGQRGKKQVSLGLHGTIVGFRIGRSGRRPRRSVRRRGPPR